MNSKAISTMGEATMGRGEETRERIVRAAATLLASGGRDAVSTRAVAAAAGVQVPTIYRLFGDMRGLLDAVIAVTLAAYMREKAGRESTGDPVADLRNGWDLNVAFGLANPAIYQLMYGDPRPGAALAALVAGGDLLRALVARVAEAGRLCVGVDRAVQMIQAAGSGVTLTLIGLAPEERDPALSEATREAVLAAIITDEQAGEDVPGAARNRAVHRAVALKAVLPEVATEFTPGERALLAEWLDAIAASAR